MGQWYWILLEQAANLVESTMMFVFIVQFFEYRRKWKGIAPISVVSLFVMINAMNFFKVGGVLSLCFFYIAGVIISMLCFRGTWSAWY